VYQVWVSGVSLPPIELVRGPDGYYVRDGHHRLSVARALGQTNVEALVIA
jgi:ParB-like chromosome segregation protein Spo0J